MISRRVGNAGRALWLLPMVLTGCLAPPDLPPRRAADSAEAPQLLPLRDILAQSESAPRTDRAADATTTEARAAALQARAAALRGPILQSGDRARMIASEPALR